jgi:acyl-CoA synthetase (AMP-forming)/AMP-acid ligase II
VASNRSIIANVKQAGMVNPSYQPGTLFLDHFPLVSTAACLLLFVPLDRGMTVLLDPLAVYMETYYESIFKFKVAFTLTAGPQMRNFFKLLTERGDNRSLENLQSLIVGAEGITKEDCLEYLEVLAACGVKNPRSVLTQGYGLSECFSVVSSEVPHIQLPGDGILRLVNSVGKVYPGTGVEIYSRDGTPLGYNQAGEVWIDRENTPSLMSRYYLNPELQEKNMPRGGKYLFTGDIGELGADGQLYIYGRASEYLGTANGRDIYANTVANYILHEDETLAAAGSVSDNLKFDDDVRYCFVNRIQLERDKLATVAHIVLRKPNAVLYGIIVRLREKLKKYFPEEFIPVGWRVYDEFLPISPTTLKTDRQTLEACRDGFFGSLENKLAAVSFIKDGNGYYQIRYKAISGA